MVFACKQVKGIVFAEQKFLLNNTLDFARNPGLKRVCESFYRNPLIIDLDKCKQLLFSQELLSELSIVDLDKSKQ